MKNKPKYLHYTGLYLEKGIRLHMELDTDYFLVGKGAGVHTYIAPVFDSGEAQESWQSFRLEGDFLDCKLEIVVAAWDKDYREILEDEQVSIEDKEELIHNLKAIRRVNTSDILLTPLRGRYFYTFWKISGREKCSFRIRGAFVEFPENTFLQYFPQVYQTKDDFFKSYISIFQTMYMDLEKEVDRLPARLDYETAEGEDLLMLAGWTGLEEVLIEEAVRGDNVERLRRLIAHAGQIQAGKGTRQTLNLVFGLLYDEKIRILEFFKWYEYVEDRPWELRLHQRLYGHDSSVLTVLIEENETMSDEKKRGMYRVISCMLPLGINCNLVYLKNSFHMDTHCYLDRNGVLASPLAASTDGTELFGNMVLQ